MNLLVILVNVKVIILYFILPWRIWYISFFFFFSIFHSKGWTIDARGWTNNAFKLWCWRRLLRVLWTAKRSILKEINLEYSLEGVVLKLKLQYFGYLIWRADSLEKTLVLGKTEGKRRVDRGCDGWMASLTHWTWVWANSRRWWRTGKPGMLQSMGSQRVGHNLAIEQQ